MDDLISRQAAIDAAIEATDSWEGVCSIGRQKRIENYINSLPFAPGMDLISRRAAIDICANVIDLFRGQFGAGVLVAIKESIEELPSALGTNLAEVGTRTVRGYPIDADALMEKVAEEYGERARDRLYQIIRYMPPAQPEPNYDEWCTDCKEYDHENSCCHRWTKVIRQTRRELQDEFVMTAVDGTLWVTVNDVQKVGRVIVDEEKSKFCKTFYGDGQVEQKWIPVTERLPENGEQVLVYARSVHYALAKYDEMREANGTYKKQWVTFDAWKPFYTIKEVIAWMPLPQPYKWKE